MIIDNTISYLVYSSITKGDYPNSMGYDAGGRLTRDSSRGITLIEYNSLNLPKHIKIGADDDVYTSYRADGIKETETNMHWYIATIVRVDAKGDTIRSDVRRRTYTSKNYKGNKVKESGKPDRVYHKFGYFDIHDNADSISYHYYITDYLGSVRAVIDSNGNMEQSVDYHSSGIPSSDYGRFTADSRLHTGKEFNDYMGIAYYDNKARTLDAILNRFTTPDPLAEKYPSISPYAHCANNPVRYTDPTGKYLVDDKNRKVTYSAKRGWSKNATADIKRVGNAMNLTKVGNRILTKMQNTNYPISIKIDKGTNKLKLGQTTTTKKNYKLNGKTTESFVAAEITIYEGGISSYQSDLKKEKIVLNKNSTITLLNKELDPTVDEMLNIVGVHEGTHATEEDSNSTFSRSVNPEKQPLVNEQATIEELIKKHK